MYGISNCLLKHWNINPNSEPKTMIFFHNFFIEKVLTHKLIIFPLVSQLSPGVKSLD